MNRYVIQIKKTTTAKVVIGYTDGVSTFVEMEPGLEPRQCEWLLSNIPVEENHLPAWAAQYAFIRYELMPPDLSFNAFWEAYAYKVGKRERAIRLWQGLNDADRTKCLRVIPRYNQWLAAKPNMERLYPETFLSQRRFENEFKI